VFLQIFSSDLAPPAEIVGGRFLAALFFLAPLGFPARDRFLDHLAPLTRPQVSCARRFLGPRRRREHSRTMAIDGRGGRARRLVEARPEPPYRLSS
jgi:hypothetical protein